MADPHSQRLPTTPLVELDMISPSLFLAAISATIPTQPAETDSFSPEWIPTFGGMPGTNGSVFAMVNFDDGAGNELFVGGSFSAAGGVLAGGIAKWNGQRWARVGNGTDFGGIQDLTVFDDGSGPALYAAGVLSGSSEYSVSRWDGSNWTVLGGGMNGMVRSLISFDDGTGEALYAGGGFSSVAGVPARGLVKWDGANWNAVDGVFSVEELAIFDDGSGPALYVAGALLTSGVTIPDRVARWDGTSWTPLGSQLASPSTLAVFDDGAGPCLYVGGQYLTSVGTPVDSIAKWNGAAWSPVGGGVSSPGVSTTRDMTVFDDGNGPALYVGGSFVNAGTVVANGIAKWDGTQWQALDQGVGDGIISSVGNGSVSSIAVFDDGSGPGIYAGGGFSVPSGVAASNVASWNGSSWSALGQGLNNYVEDLVVFDDGTGPALFVGGNFIHTGSVLASRIAKWDGSTWASLGTGMDSSVTCLHEFDDGTGPSLVAGGIFTTAGGTAASRIAKWDGSSWTPLGSGLDGSVRALETFDDGTGVALYAAGSFQNAGGVPCSRIAKWDGSSWTPLGAGLSSPASAMEVFDDGTGPALFVGGLFFSAGGSPASRIARWDGTSWSSPGAGLAGEVLSLVTFDDGLGPALYAGGGLLLGGPNFAPGIAKWDGMNWSPLGGSVVNMLECRELSVVSDGVREWLFAGGTFSSSSGAPANRIARWNGAAWDGLGEGMDDAVLAIQEFDDGAGDALYAGGFFSSAADSGDSFLARWGCTVLQFSDSCNGDGGNQLGCTSCPCTNDAPPGTVGGCVNVALSSARLLASGSNSVSRGNLLFETTGLPPDTSAVLISADSIAPAGIGNPCFGLNSGVTSTTLDGLRCVVQGVQRHGARSSNANGEIGSTNNGWGEPAGLQNSEPFITGNTRHFQVIYRDDPQAGCQSGLNTSQSVSISFAP